MSMFTGTMLSSKPRSRSATQLHNWYSMDMKAIDDVYVDLKVISADNHVYRSWFYHETRRPIVEATSLTVTNIDTPSFVIQT